MPRGGIFNLVKLAAKLLMAREFTTCVAIWDRIPAIRQPVDLFNGLLKSKSSTSTTNRFDGWKCQSIYILKLTKAVAVDVSELVGDVLL